MGGTDDFGEISGALGSEGQGDFTAKAHDDEGPVRPVIPVVGIGASAGGLEVFTASARRFARHTGFRHRIHSTSRSESPQHAGRNSGARHRHTGQRSGRWHARGSQPRLRHTGRLRSDHRRRGAEAGPTYANGRDRTCPSTVSCGPLAGQCGSRAIGVILSGTGSDGSAGVEAIKAAGGVTFAQDAATAKFATMPQAAVATGCVDFVLPPERIAAELVRIGRHPYIADVPRAQRERTPAADEERFGSYPGYSARGNRHRLFAIPGEDGQAPHPAAARPAQYRRPRGIHASGWRTIPMN